MKKTGKTPKKPGKKSLTIQDFARMGGKARAERLSKEELSQQGRKAVQTRWEREKAGRDPKGRRH